MQLYEEYPTCYSADLSRRYRWMRGDWQIAGWLLPRVPGRHGAQRKNPLSKLSQALFTIACPPYEALVGLDAMVRSLWRMQVSHRGLLEWTVLGALTHRRGLVGFYRQMWVAPLLAVVTALGVAAVNPATLTAAGPLLLLWFASPAVARWISRPLRRRSAHLSADQTRFLRMLSRIHHLREYAVPIDVQWEPVRGAV